MKKNILNRWYLILPAIFLFIYIIIRAKVLSLTWDEANTFFEYVRTPRWFPQDFNYMSANNHLLNTWLMKCSVTFFGDGELALRLPNVIAGGIYFIAAMKLSEKMFEKKWMILAAFLLLTLNPYILDFFSTARGYGISLALMVCALVQLSRYVMEAHELKRGIYSQVFLVAATLANLTMIYLLLGTTFLLVCNRFVFHKGNRPAVAAIKLTLLPIIAMFFFIPYSQKLKMCGAFYFGEETKSAADTFLSLSKDSFYGTIYSGYFVPAITIIFSAIPLFSLLIVAKNIFSLHDARRKWMVLITLLLIICIAGPILQHQLFKTNLLAGRTALFYIPLLLLNFLCLLHFLPNLLRNISIACAGIFSIAHFYFAANIYSFYDYREQADVKAAMLVLKADKSILQPDIYANIISTDLPFEKQINYYRMRFGMDNFSHAARKENVPSCSYYYLPESQFPYSKTIDVIGSWPTTTHTILYRQLNRPKLKYITEVWQDFEHEDPLPQLRTDSVYIGNKGTFAGKDHPYSILIPLDIPDSLKGQLVATLNCRLFCYTKNTSALLVFCFDDENKDAWEAMHISELSIKPKEWSITGWTRPVPPGAKKIRVFLWNLDNTDVLMDNVALRLLSVPN
jgi:4-amino-4-deoxy-L-arabinose transferase-like glycosyltransferase